MKNEKVSLIEPSETLDRGPDPFVPLAVGGMAALVALSVYFALKLW